MKEYIVKVYENHTEWHNAEGQLHREDGPALEWSGGYKEWYLNGQLHREDGPAIEYADGGKEWYLNGQQLTEAEFNARTQPVEMTVEQVCQALGKNIKIVKG